MPIGLTDTMCSSDSVCLSTCAACLLPEVTICDHSEDVDIHCREFNVHVYGHKLNITVLVMMSFSAEYSEGISEYGNSLNGCDIGNGNVDSIYGILKFL